MHQLLDCCAYDNRWSRRHPLEKLVFGGGMLLLALLLPPPGGLAVLAAVSLVTLLGPRINPLVYLKVLALPLIFVLPGIGSVLVSLSLEQGSFSVGLAPQGPELAWKLLNRALGASSAMLFLALTTPVAEWIALARHPALREVGDLALLIYRFIFAFFRTAQTLRTAQEARNGYRTLRMGMHAAGLLVSRLLVRVLDRVRGMETGMAVRGYDGRMLLLTRQDRLSWRTVSGFLVLEAVLAAMVLVLPRLVHHAG